MGRARLDESGQAVPLLLGVLAVALVMVVAVGRVGEAAVEAARARTAADAAALAGVRDGRGGAEQAAADNGGTVVWFRQDGADVVVRVEVDGAAAEARATLASTRHRLDHSWRDRPAYTRDVATDERPHVASEPLAKDASVTGGNGNGNGRAPERAAVIAGPVSSFATSTTASSRPAPAVPLVPPSRPSTRPIAPTPIARTGTATSPLFIDHDLEVDAEPAAVAAPVPARPPVRVRMARRPRVRKVNRIVRRVDAWSVFKIALVFWAVTVVILLVAGVLLWNLAESTGTLTNIEGFIKELFGLETFEFNGSKVFRASWMIGAVLAVAMTATTVTMAVLFNLISDLLGGVRVTVLEEEVVLRRAPAAVAAPAPQPPPDAAATNGG